MRKHTKRARLGVERLDERVVPATFTVSNTLDSGAGSLRDAISKANVQSGADEITFAPAAAGTITLASTLTVTDQLTITGPGAKALAVSGGDKVRVFDLLAGPVTISGLTITNGRVTGAGGGIRTATGTGLNLTDSVVTKCVASGDGGGIEANSSLIIGGSTVSGNTAGGFGGGIDVNAGAVVMTNSTVAGNTAANSGGGILFNSSAGTFLVSSSTFVRNQAGGNGGGGIRRIAGDVVLLNTIVALNTKGTSTPDDISSSNAATPFTGNGVLTSTNSGFSYTTTGSGNNQTVANPLLGDLGDNGGPTPTVTPFVGSPAINKGVAAGAPTTDQRGLARPSGAGVDIGAVEVQQGSTSPPTTVPPTTGTGKSPLPSTTTQVLAGGGGSGTATEYTLTGGKLAAGRTITFPGLSGVLHTAVGNPNTGGTQFYVGATSGGVPGRVVVLDGKTPDKVYATLAPYGDAFTGGINVAVADFTGDGIADVAVAPDRADGAGGDAAPEVIVYDGAALAAGTQTVLAKFLGLNQPGSGKGGPGEDPNFKGGLRLGVGDVNGDGTPDLLVGAGTGGGPRITVWDGTSLKGGGQPTATPLINLFVFEESQRGGAYISAGDVSGDRWDDLIFGGGPGGSTRIRTVDGRLLFGLPAAQLQALNLDNSGSFPSGLLRDNFFAAGDANFRGGVRLTTRDVDGDKIADIITGSGDGAAGSVRVYTAPQLDAARGKVDPASQDPLAVGGGSLATGVYVG